MDAVRYRPNQDNSVLRHVLCEVWALQCYWCREFKKYLELQIDHIVPLLGTDAEQKRLQEAFELESDYDVHAVANLAPICSPCDRRKSNTDLRRSPVVLTHLERARQHAPAVVTRFHALAATATGDLGGALLLAANADLADADIRAAFEVGAPAIVQRLSELGDGKADHLVHRDVVVEARDERHSFSISLDEHGRAALAMLQDVAGGELEEALREPIIDLFHQVGKALAAEYRAEDDRVGEAEVGSVQVDWSTLVVQKMACTATPPAQLVFEFEGAFDGLASASVSWPSVEGSELEDAQANVTFSCRFQFDLSWEPSDPAGSFFFDRVWLDDLEAGPWSTASAVRTRGTGPEELVEPVVG
jgi:5-methylcytosine-specific restriction endonuclease McrA